VYGDGAREWDMEFQMVHVHFSKMQAVSGENHSKRCICLQQVGKLAAGLFDRRPLCAESVSQHCCWLWLS